MRLATFEVGGEPGPVAGLVDPGSGRVTELAGADGADGVRAVLAGELPATEGPRSWPLQEVSLLAPVPAPRAIYGVGRNYDAHIAEMGRERPARPLVFLKPTAAANAPAGPVHRPAIVEQLDYEGELAIVIGAGGAIGGYCVADDVTARELQDAEPQWSRAKGADGFCPFGPWVTTADEVPDPGALRVRTWVNGEPRQDGATADMIFDCAAVVAFIAETNTLSPGDLVLTGTPEGVGRAMDPPRWLAPGDRVRIAIDELGEIEHAIA